MFKLELGEQLVKKTKPHSASFLSSPTFWIGLLILILGFIARPFGGIIRLILSLLGVVFIGLSYLRRVNSYTFYFTDRRIVSTYSFIRRAERVIYYNKLLEATIIQGIFGKIAGYSDLWLYGYQEGWVVGRMRGVRLGDSQIVLTKAWKDKIKDIAA